MCQGALARAIGPHHGVNFAGSDFQAEALQYGFAANAYAQLIDFQHLDLYLCL
jgi:hypothetical protein